MKWKEKKALKTSRARLRGAQTTSRCCIGTGFGIVFASDAQNIALRLVPRKISHLSSQIKMNVSGSMAGIVKAGGLSGIAQANIAPRGMASSAIKAGVEGGRKNSGA